MSAVAPFAWVAFNVFGKPLLLERQAASAVSRSLVDPESARFYELQEGKAGSVCGLVNARNRLGGYVGSRAFIAFQSGTAEIAGPPADKSDTQAANQAETFRELWALHCTR